MTGINNGWRSVGFPGKATGLSMLHDSFPGDPQPSGRSADSPPFSVEAMTSHVLFLNLTPAPGPGLDSDLNLAQDGPGGPVSGQPKGMLGAPGGAGLQPPDAGASGIRGGRDHAEGSGEPRASRVCPAGCVNTVTKYTDEFQGPPDGNGRRG